MRRIQRNLTDVHHELADIKIAHPEGGQESQFPDEAHFRRGSVPVLPDGESIHSL